MVCSDTLRIKHLPKELSEVQKEDFVRHFGAIKVKVITSKAKAKSVVYAKFENQDVAKNVLFRLHQLNVLNCRICVEYAEIDILQGAPIARKTSDLKDVPDQRFLKNFINSINAFNDSVGFHQPPPSHLKYNYPKANRSTINNIAHALATVPRFYTQVLHLMNKMNLPPPFAMPEPPVRVIQPSPHPVLSQKAQEIISEKRKMSSSESEIESDGESNKNTEIIPQKRSLPQKRVVKRPKFIKQPVVQASASTKLIEKEKPQDVFEKVNVQQPKKIELRVMPELPPEPKKLELKPERTKQIDTVEITPQKIQLPETIRPEQTKLTEKDKELCAKQKVMDHIPKEEQKSFLNKPEPTVSKLEVMKPVNKIEKIEPITETSNTMFIGPAKPAQKSMEQDKQPVIGPSVHKETLVKKKPEVQQSPPQLAQPLINPQTVNLQEPLHKQDRALEAAQLHAELLQKPTEVLQPVQQVESAETLSEILPEPTSPDDEFPRISLEELKANQITDLSVMPVFKNYKPGDPTNKLYIKNCAKTVAVMDLEYIYNRYREEGTDDKPSEFNIRLMQEGRMKGQAFVTLDSVGMAQKAVTETNGFILKDKPLVVVFGKAGKKK